MSERASEWVSEPNLHEKPTKQTEPKIAKAEGVT
jgi:hypothetical protein